MLLSLIVAMADNRVIGRDNRLPWHLPADLKHFKALTMGKPVLMGRLTWESIGRPLPGRRNVVITRDRHYRASGCEVVGSVAEALHRLAASKEVMVIGGARLYEQTLPVADRLYITYIHADFDGDVRFPEFSPAEWRELAREDHGTDEKQPYAYSFVTLARVRASPAGSPPGTQR